MHVIPLSQLQHFYGHTHTKKSFLFLFFFFFFSHWNLCSTPSVPQQERTLFFSPSLFVSLLTYRSLLVGLQVNGMHTKRKRKGAYLQRTRKTQRAKTNRFPLKLTLDKLNFLACLLPSSLVLNIQLCRIAMKNKCETLFVWG